MSIRVMLFVVALFAPDAGEQTTAARDYSQEARPTAAPKTAPKTAQENYKAFCLPCHGPEGNGLMPAMSLTDGTWKHGSTLPAVTKTIRDGVQGTMMLPFKDKLSKAEILELAKLARRFDPKFTSKARAR